jgi:hypothetical protein
MPDMGEAASGPDPAEALRREQTAERLRQLGLDPGLIANALRDVKRDQIRLLEEILGRIAPASREATDDTMSLADYEDLLNNICEEYTSAVTAPDIAKVAGVTHAQLLDAMQVLAQDARMLRSIPLAARTVMWAAVRQELQGAAQHYERVRRAVVDTGIVDALEAQRYAAIAHLRREPIPAVDLQVLRMVGHEDPERALRQQIRAARVAARGLLQTSSVETILLEGEKYLQQASAPNTAAQLVPAPRPKRWSAWGKLLKGAAVMAGNIVAPLGAGLVGGPVAGIVVTPATLASCAGGIGEICEGVGALRGE